MWSGVNSALGVWSCSLGAENEPDWRTVLSCLDRTTALRETNCSEQRKHENQNTIYTNPKCKHRTSYTKSKVFNRHGTEHFRTFPKSVWDVGSLHRLPKFFSLEGFESNGAGKNRPKESLEICGANAELSERPDRPSKRRHCWTSWLQSWWFDLFKHFHRLS